MFQTFPQIFPHMSRLNKIATAIAPIVLACSALAIVVPAEAQQRRLQPMAPTVAEPNWYLGIGVGTTKASAAGDSHLQIAGQNSIAYSADNKTSSGKAFFGMKLNSSFGFEVGYAHLGELQANRTFGTTTTSQDAAGNTVTTSSPTGSYSATPKIRAITAFAVAWLPIFESGLALFGKAGLARTSVDINASTTLPGFVAQSTHRRETNFAYGFGLQYNLNRSFALRAEYEVINNVGNRNDHGWESHLTSVTGSAMYRF